MSATTSIVTGVVSIPTRGRRRGGRHHRQRLCHQATFEDPDGTSLDLHHRYAPRA